MHILKSLINKTKNIFKREFKENIFFLHIPKCGGTSIKRAIERNYPSGDRVAMLDPVASSNAAKLFDYPTLKFRENLLLYFMRINNMKYISGHYCFSEIAFREFHDKFVFITVLREPVSRWISLYFYNKYKKSNHFKTQADFAEYLQSELGHSVGHTYVKFLCGVDNSIDYTSRQAIERAKKNLDKFDIVGCLEYQEDFIKQFERRFGARLALKRENQSPVAESFKSSVITEEVEEKIRLICEPDIEVYQYAIDKFVKANH